MLYRGFYVLFRGFMALQPSPEEAPFDCGTGSLATPFIVEVEEVGSILANGTDVHTGEPFDRILEHKECCGISCANSLQFNTRFNSEAYDPRLSGKITEAEFRQVIQNIHSGFDTDAGVKSADSAAGTSKKLLGVSQCSFFAILICIVVLIITQKGLDNFGPVATGITIVLVILLVVLLVSCHIVSTMWGPREESQSITAYGAVVSRETAAWHARGISTTYCPRRIESHSQQETSVTVSAKLRISVVASM